MVFMEGEDIEKSIEVNREAPAYGAFSCILLARGSPRCQFARYGMRIVPSIARGGLLVLAGCLLIGGCPMLGGCQKQEQLPSGTKTPVNEDVVPKPEASVSPAASLAPSPAPAGGAQSPGA